MELFGVALRRSERSIELFDQLRELGCRLGLVGGLPMTASLGGHIWERKGHYSTNAQGIWLVDPQRS